MQVAYTSAFWVLWNFLKYFKLNFLRRDSTSQKIYLIGILPIKSLDDFSKALYSYILPAQTGCEIYGLASESLLLQKDVESHR